MSKPHPWTDQEVDLLRHLAACKLSPTQIADAFAIIGWQTREANAVQKKGYALGVEWKGERRYG